MNLNYRLPQSRRLKRLSVCLSYCLSLSSVLAVSAEAIAQPLPERIALPLAPHEIIAQDSIAEPPAQEAVSTPTEATALRLQPFYNLDYTEGAGHTGFTSFGGFYPLFQTPGENVTFIDGRVSVNNTGNLGGGLQVGHRALLDDSTIWGAYAGIDVRDTGNRTFTQAGIGTELLGENWDVNLNANIPLGNARQVVSSSTQSINPRFVGSQLLIDQGLTEQIEAALTTVSLEGGLELFDFGEGSSLWGRGGVYYLGGAASQDTVGFRASLDYRLQNNLRFGVGVQNDGVFDTNVVFSVNALLGAPAQGPSEADTTAQERLWARAGEPIARTNTVLVEAQRDVSQLQAGVAAANPVTGQDYAFLHVLPTTGTAAAAGTIEAPLDTIANAANMANANADNIIYVQAGNAGGAFTLPDGVQVRSVGPIQQLNTQFGSATLPGSGSGTLPTVSGTATIGSNTFLSGVAINSAGDVGILASGPNITIADNTITNADRGIRLQQIDGTVTIVRNQVSDTDNSGIEFDYITDDANTTVTVSNNQITNAGVDGIYFYDIRDNANATITVSNNQVTDSGRVGIDFYDIENNANATVTVSNNQITNAGVDGIYFGTIRDDANATVTVSNNQITNSRDSGIEFRAISDDANATVTISNNQITNSRDSGIHFSGRESFVGESANATITISNNQITNSRDSGIEFRAIRDNANATVTISNNHITNSGNDGIEFNDKGGFVRERANATITISGNHITDSGRNGIEFGIVRDDANATVTISNNHITSAGIDGIDFFDIEENANVTTAITNNTITNPGDNGVRVNHTAATNVCLALDNNTVTTPGGDGFEFVSTGAGQFQVLDLANVTTRNVGTFNPADIATNAAFVNGTVGVAPCP